MGPFAMPALRLRQAVWLPWRLSWEGGGFREAAVTSFGFRDLETRVLGGAGFRVDGFRFRDVLRVGYRASGLGIKVLGLKADCLEVHGVR